MRSLTIPRIIHQTWKTSELGERFSRFSRSWKHHHPNWEYRFYSDVDCRVFVEREFPDWLSAYDQYPRQIQRIDLFRYLVVLKYGGVYADMDMECLKPIEPLIEGKKSVFSIEAHLTKQFQTEREYAQPYQIANCIFAAEPQNAFLKQILRRIRSIGQHPISSDLDVETTTGPVMLTRLFYSLEDDIRNTIGVLPQINFLAPKEYPDVFPFNVNIYARHHCAGTWKEEKGATSLGRRLVERNRLPALGSLFPKP